MLYDLRVQTSTLVLVSDPLALIPLPSMDSISSDPHFLNTTGL